MSRIKRLLITGLIIGLIAFAAVPAFSGSINLKDAGVPLWIFIIIGGVVVLFQLIPSTILFFSFLGTTTLIVFRIKKALEELPVKEREKVVLPRYEQTTITKNRSGTVRE